MADLVRQLAAVACVALLGGCGYPEFNRYEDEYKVRALALDARFPLLKAYQRCTGACDQSDDYTFVHVDERSSRSAVPLDLYAAPSSFTGPLRQHLVPSFSLDPAVRVLDSYLTTESIGMQYRHVRLYRPRGGHAVQVTLEPAACQPSMARGFRPAAQPVAFAAVIRDTVVLFLEPAGPGCGDTLPAQVLGSTAGLPAGLAQRPYLVYAVAVDGTDSLRAQPVHGLACRDEHADSPVAAPCVGRGKALAADPVPDVAFAAVKPGYACRERGSSTDWVLYGGMVARKHGAVSSTVACTPLP